MFNRREIFKRVATCYPGKLIELAQKMQVAPQVVDHWKTGRTPIPWVKLKDLVDEQGLSWDWLIEGKEPKHRDPCRKVADQSLNRHEINQRFLSLYPGLSNAKLGKILGVNGSTVFKWRHDMEQVGWERLKHEVDAKGVTWEWLIEGR